MMNLIRLVYVSTTTKPVDLNKGTVQSDVGRILMQARKNNPAHRIGGVLYFSNNFFFQCLEGEQEAVSRLFKKIAKDPRHTNVKTIAVKRIQQRKFANWSMKYVALEETVNQLLKQNGFSEFKPYEFNADFVDKILNLFVTVDASTAQADRHYQGVGDEKPKPGFMSRLFNRNRAA